MRTLSALLLVLLLAGPVAAQDKGQSKFAFGFALAGQVTDIVTTEMALAAGGREGNPLMRKRAVRIPFKLALPLISHWATKDFPRGRANAHAYIIGVGGFAPGAWNIYVTMKLKER